MAVVVIWLSVGGVTRLHETERDRGAFAGRMWYTPVFLSVVFKECSRRCARIHRLGCFLLVIMRMRCVAGQKTSAQATSRCEDEDEDEDLGIAESSEQRDGCCCCCNVMYS